MVSNSNPHLGGLRPICLFGQHVAILWSTDLRGSRKWRFRAPRFCSREKKTNCKHLQVWLVIKQKKTPPFPEVGLG